MADTSADAGGGKCAKGLVLLAVLGLRVGWSRKEIVKRNDLYIKDTSRKLRLTTTRRWRRKVMSEPPTMPLVPRFGISHMPDGANLVWADRKFTIVGRLFGGILFATTGSQFMRSSVFANWERPPG